MAGFRTPLPGLCLLFLLLQAFGALGDPKSALSDELSELHVDEKEKEEMEALSEDVAARYKRPLIRVFKAPRVSGRPQPKKATPSSASASVAEEVPKITLKGKPDEPPPKKQHLDDSLTAALFQDIDDDGDMEVMPRRYQGQGYKIDKKPQAETPTAKGDDAPDVGLLV
eukprot:TRINITY_DN2672_c1_g1_i2.p1 TRINITY_DN2672_c1_g1~~TRINITY_DN2672_c1_g1_i2.p1  ORF type:complete len:169 (+),score=36.23 TRINITY_DN2672_c1_g1_i2:88-594(+)